MEKRYWVPALEKMHHILELLQAEPHQLKLIDLSKRLGINKSSMFSLLHTLETLNWIEREEGDTYALGSFAGALGMAYFKQYDLIAQFHREAEETRLRIGETIQLAKLEGDQVLYLAKQESPSPVRLASDPGMKLPAHVTALGKSLLAMLSEAELNAVYPEEQLPGMTTNTLRSKRDLASQLSVIRKQGCAFDLQEAVIGFSCVAAPVMGTGGKAIAAVSCSMPQHLWESKQELAQREIGDLARRLSSSHDI